MGEGNLTPKRVVYEAQSAVSLILTKACSVIYVKIAICGIVKHTGNDAPLLQSLQVITICAAGSCVAERIHVGS